MNRRILACLCLSCADRMKYLCEWQFTEAEREVEILRLRLNDWTADRDFTWTPSGESGEEGQDVQSGPVELPLGSQAFVEQVFLV